METNGLIQYFIRLWRYKWLLVIAWILAGSSSYYYLKVTPKEYEATATFFVIKTDNGNPLSGLGSYAQLLGSPGQTLELYVSAFLDSAQLQTRITRHFLDRHATDTDLSQMNKSLKLKKKLKSTQDKNDIFHVTYSHANPGTALTVVKQSIALLDVMSVELDITPHRGIITILDPPKVGTQPINPIPTLVILQFFAGFTVAGLLIIASIPFFSAVRVAYRESNQRPTPTIEQVKDNE